MQRPVCYRDLKTSTQNYIHRVWQETWDQQVLNKLHSIHPSTSHWAALPVRRHDVRLTRLRIGHISFHAQAPSVGPNLPSKIKAGYLNCKLRPYIPNPLRCFKCQRFGHSQNSCRGQLTCSRCAAVGHSSTDCTLEPKCINCSQIHTADSKLCPKWKTEKEIQTIKTNKNISYFEARKLIAPQFSQTYAQVAKPSIATSTTQTDENITKVKCPPLQILKPLVSVPHPNASPSITSNSTSSSTTQVNLLPSASSIKRTTQTESQVT
ncbi:uncharacterized protein TNCV_1784061 [Trichonephila clavipes]|nr:uncharacterized protein TNCV_1784061 [Trichonephila clavipes]